MQSVLFVALSLTFILFASAQTQESRSLIDSQVTALPSREKRWALIIGINEYQRDVSSLQGAVNDAKALREILINHAGFPSNQIILLTTDASDPEKLPTRNNILDALDSLKDRIPEDGLLLFSFSGHGVAVDNEAYLVPTDGRITKNVRLLRDFSIEVRRIKEAVDEIKVQQVVVLLDACRNEPGRGDTPNVLTEAYKRGFSFEIVNAGVRAFATLYATSVGGRAFEYLDRDTKRFRGYFSQAIEEGLRGKAANARGEVTLGSLTEYVDRTVPARVLSSKGETQEPSKEIAGYKVNELVLAIAPVGSSANTNVVSKIDPVAVEREYWEVIRNSDDVLEFDRYIKAYPNGAYVGIAQAKIRQLEAQKKKMSSSSPSTLDQPSGAGLDNNVRPPPVNPVKSSKVEPPNTNFTIKVAVRADNASNGWTNSGLVIRRGQQVRIRASGQISLGQGRSSTPAGAPNITDSNKLMRQEPTGGLIAVIGDDNDDFIFVGSQTEFTAKRDGVLFLGVNEGDLTDNTGMYDAAIDSRLLEDTSPLSAAASTAPAGFVRTKVRVRADATTNGWTNSGVVVHKGQTIQVTGYGLVGLGKGRFSTPNGLHVVDEKKLMLGQLTGGLIAVIGNDNDEFIFIGTGREFVAQRDGALFLGVNEGDLTDNSGSYDVVVDAKSEVSSQSNNSQAPTFYSFNVNVLADNTKNGWTNSGLIVRVGQQIRITASGQVSLGNGVTSSPAGRSDVADTGKLMRSHPTGGLIAVVGDDNDDFIFIGAAGEFTAKRNGVLFLGVNEGNLTDNTGSYQVVVNASVQK